MSDEEQAVDALERVRRLHDALCEETALTSPDDEITRGAAAKKIAAALDGWTRPADRFAAKVNAVREETRREILGDDLNPSSLVLDAQAYRRLRETITSTMDDPDRWDRDGDEESILSDYVRWLADGKPARDDGWEDEAVPARTALPVVLRGAADRIDAEDVPQTSGDTASFVDGVRWATGQLRAVAGEADTAPGDDAGWLPDWLAELAREHAASLLTDTERAMLRYALGLAEDKMLSRGDEFTDDEDEAVTSLKRLAGEGGDGR